MRAGKAAFFEPWGIFDTVSPFATVVPYTEEKWTFGIGQFYHLT